MEKGAAELVREIIEAFNRADVDGVLARFDRGFEWRTLADTPAAGTYTGHAQVRRYIEDWLATFDDLRMDAGEVLEQGERVVVAVHGYGRGSASGIEVDTRYCQVWTVRDGAAVRMEEHESWDQALTAVRAAHSPPADPYPHS